VDGHYKSIHRSFEIGDLTAPSLSISEMQLARAISEFTSFPPNEASIETLEKRLSRNIDALFGVLPVSAATKIKSAGRSCRWVFCCGLVLSSF
jgi:hypothetical protein